MEIIDDNTDEDDIGPPETVSDYFCYILTLYSENALRKLEKTQDIVRDLYQNREHYSYDGKVYRRIDRFLTNIPPESVKTARRNVTRFRQKMVSLGYNQIPMYDELMKLDKGCACWDSWDTVIHSLPPKYLEKFYRMPKSEEEMIKEDLQVEPKSKILPEPKPKSFSLRKRKKVHVTLMAEKSGLKQRKVSVKGGRFKYDSRKMKKEVTIEKESLSVLYRKHQK